MAEIFRFGIAEPALDETEVDAVKCYESANGNDGWAEVGSASIADLTPKNGVYTWEVAGADPSHYHTIVPVSAGDVERQGSAILPPRTTNAALCTVFLTVKKQNGQPEVGVEVSSHLKQVPTAVSGAILSTTVAKAKTDANGLATLTLVRGAKYDITATPLGKKITIDTTGKSSVDVALTI